MSAKIGVLPGAQPMVRTFGEGADELRAAMAQVEQETGEKPIAATRYACLEGEIMVMTARSTFILRQVAEPESFAHRELVK